MDGFMFIGDDQPPPQTTSQSNGPPKKFGQKWTKQEENKVIEGIKDDKSIDEIAEAHNRSYGSILARLKKIAYDLHRKGTSIDLIKKKTSLDTNIIKKSIAEFDQKYGNGPSKFSKNNNNGVSQNDNTSVLKELDQLKKQVKSMDAKIDKLLGLLDTSGKILNVWYDENLRPKTKKDKASDKLVDVKANLDSWCKDNGGEQFTDQQVIDFLVDKGHRVNTKVMGIKIK